MTAWGGQPDGRRATICGTIRVMTVSPAVVPGGVTQPHDSAIALRLRRPQLDHFGLGIQGVAWTYRRCPTQLLHARRPDSRLSYHAELEEHPKRQGKGLEPARDDAAEMSLRRRLLVDVEALGIVAGREVDDRRFGKRHPLRDEALSDLEFFEPLATHGGLLCKS